MIVAYRMILDKEATALNEGLVVYDVYRGEEETPAGTVKLGEDDHWWVVGTAKRFSASMDAVKFVCRETP